MATATPYIPSSPEPAPRQVVLPEGLEILPTSPHENFGKKSEKNSLNWKKDVKLRYRVAAWSANKAYNILDTFVRFDEKIAKENAHFQKHIREIVDTGPDEDERIIFAQKDAFGVFRKYDGTPVSAERVKRARKKAKFSMPRIQALAAYEITKLEEHEQEEGWQRIIDIMYKDLGFTHHEVFNVMIGLQFMNKAKYLTFKHRKLEHPPMRDANGKVIKEFVPELDKDGNLAYENVQVGVDEHGNPEMERRLKGKLETQEDHDRLVLGKINVRAYVTELAAKFETYRYSFNPADIATLVLTVRECRKICDDMVTMKAGETIDDVQARVNLPAFRDTLYALNRISMAIEASKMGSATDTEGEMSDQASIQEAQRIAAERTSVNTVTDAQGNLKASTLAELREAGLRDEDMQEFKRHLKPEMTVADLMNALAAYKTEQEGRGQEIKIKNMKAAGKPFSYPPRISSSAEANRLWQKVSDEIDVAKTTYGPWMNQINEEDYIKNHALRFSGLDIEGKYTPENSREQHEKAKPQVPSLKQKREEREAREEEERQRRASQPPTTAQAA